MVMMMMILGGEECGGVSFGDIACGALVEVAMGGSSRWWCWWGWWCGGSGEDDSTVKEVLHISSYCKQTCSVGWYQSR